ncbi:MAG: hypothetical protein ABI690_14140 [Chloroflexota bacterium]
MPTPFTHLETAQRLLQDDQIPQSIRDALNAECPAFLLGNIAADARTESGMKREDTHFYSYDKGISEHPWRVMLQTHPSLETTHSLAQRVFLAGYAAHLSMDEWWSLHMLGPHFANREWAPRPQRFLMLHIILIYMDERDHSQLQPWQYQTLEAAQPEDWTPFMSDTILRDWRDFIARQIKPGNASETLDVLGSRVNMQPAELRAILDDPEKMQNDLWQHIPQTLLAEIEADMYRHAREQMLIYWAESDKSSREYKVRSTE